jgi:anion-transporting  ArsA/GET3 family ATPase
VKGLSTQRLVVVTGKGGVGKTTVAAALARASERAGHKTLVCEVNARERIAPLLGHSAVGPELTQLSERLWAVNVQPHEALKEYALMTLKFETLYSAVFENRLVRYFLRFIPSLQELVLLGKILHHMREKGPDGAARFDRIIVDAPATGHAQTFLSVPRVLLETVPPGALADDARWMHDLLVDPTQTAAVLVSLPEELPVNETIELTQALRQTVKVQPAAVVLNAATDPRFTSADLDALAPALKALAHTHLGRSMMSSLCRDRLAELGLPVTVLPRLFSPFNASAISTLAELLESP